MKPPKTKKTEFEKVKIDEFIPGIIEEIKYEEKHKFIWKGEEKINPGVRFKFKLDGYKFPHYSRWMYFGYGEKAGLYQKFLIQLVENAKPEMDFDLDKLKGMKIKTLWSENGEFQNLEIIRPLKEKLKNIVSKNSDLAEVEEDEQPF